MVLILLKPKYDGPFLSATVNVDLCVFHYIINATVPRLKQCWGTNRRDLMIYFVYPFSWP